MLCSATVAALDSRAQAPRLTGKGYILMFLSLLFWAFLASYVIYILDEALLNGGFVRWIVDNFWPAYENSYLALQETAE